jgi:hypothetical protein
VGATGVCVGGKTLEEVAAGIFVDKEGVSVDGKGVGDAATAEVAVFVGELVPVTVGVVVGI